MQKMYATNTKGDWPITLTDSEGGGGRGVRTPPGKSQVAICFLFGNFFLLNY